jgi:DNA-binding response OmpR family regulator/nitrogen-specific signal transduction histidine kinase
LAVGIFLLYRKLTIEREKEKAALNYEKMEKQKITELNQQRMNFYTYISHEFKTPLSIIISSVDQLFEDKDISESLKEKFRRLSRSSKRLSFLFNQLMDFRKIETKHAKLVLQKGDVIGFIKETCLVFSPMFDQQRVNFEFSTNMDASEHWFDPDKIEKIIVNLISNALKNTPVHGKIVCNATILENEGTGDKSKLEIRISDTGIGISPGEIEKLFTPFYKYYGSSEEKQGSGIGLTLVNSLVEYLRGTIDVSSEVNQGTVFTVQLPLDYKEISNIKLENNDDIVNRSIDIDSIIDLSSSKINPAPLVDSESEFKLLIVEDTIDLSDILTEHFSRHFKVSHAPNGVEALKIVKEEEPDIIVSDIMMPEMNGIDFCRMIKQDEATSHIAVILLTAKTLHEDRIEGLKAGAEAYITKPFDLAELDLHVRNFLEVRKKLKEKVISGEDIDLEKLNFQEKDKEFIGKVSEVIHQNIENELFNTELLAKQLGMSKTLVYLKLKKLLNMSGTDYIQLLRLKKSIELMADQNLTISEIAYEVGFSDPNYFSKVFKKAYKLTPSEYRRQLHEQLAAKSSDRKKNPYD